MINKNLNIDFVTEEIWIELAAIQNISKFKLGTKRFLDSVHTVTIN